MLVSQLNGLGDLTSSLAHRKTTITPAGTSSTPNLVKPSLRSAAAISQARQAHILATFNPASLNLVGRHRQDQIARKTADYLGAKFASVTPAALKPKLPTVVPASVATSSPAPMASVASALRNALVRGGLSTTTTNPYATRDAMNAASAAAAQAVASAAPASTTALTTTAPLPSMSTGGGGGGGGGGGDVAPPDMTDATAADQLTGWAALSPTAKVAIVLGGVVVAYVGYRVVRRR